MNKLLPTLSAQAVQWMDSLLSNSVDHAVLFLTPEARVVEWLGAAPRLFGYTAEQAVGIPMSALFTAADIELGLDQQEIAVASSSGHSEDDHWLVRQDGSVFWASCVLTAVRNAQGELVALCKVVRDRTDVRTQITALENQLAARTAELERRDHSAMTIAHQLRAPLMPIMTALALLQRSDDETLRRRACDIIERQSRLMKSLIDDLTPSGLAAGGGRQLAKQRMNVGDAMREAADRLLDTMNANRQDFRMYLPDPPLWIDADPLQFQTMLFNLLVNAVQNTPQGGHIRMSATIENDKAVVRVEDDGVGVSSEVMPHIFALFTREGSATQTRGLGMGLAVVHDLVRRHGGNAEARSAGADQGSVFVLRVPVGQGGADAPLKDAS